MSSVSINPALLRVIRFCVAAVWIYEGLFQKIVGPAEHELAVVQSLPGLPVSALTLLRIIGIGETLLGIAVASGLYARPLAIFQGLLLITMNGLGIALGGGAIADPVGLIVKNLPLLCCIALLGVAGGAPPRAASSEPR
jgi:uncharacterized membrane protein YphA (DoxX/SURF4 family)